MMAERKKKRNGCFVAAAGPQLLSQERKFSPVGPEGMRQKQ